MLFLLQIRWTKAITICVGNSCRMWNVAVMVVINILEPPVDFSRDPVIFHGTIPTRPSILHGIPCVVIHGIPWLFTGSHSFSRDPVKQSTGSRQPWRHKYMYIRVSPGRPF
jgi:hypothetical protein